MVWPDALDIGIDRSHTMITWITVMRWLRSPCLFGHAPFVYERDAAGTLLLVCPNCRTAHPVLVTP
jgi:hypothetical protein